VHEHLLTHRMLSRNTRSNRAVSTAKLADQPIFVPDDLRLDDRRMRQDWALPDEAMCRARRLWVLAAVGAERWARRLAALGVHRQTANRLMEPFKYTVTVATATDWPWWFRLRCAGDAQGETQKLARLMLAAYVASTPARRCPGEWHLPFVTPEDCARSRHEPTACPEAYLCALATARAARVSTLTFEGRLDPSADLRLHDDLVRGQEWSPFEHAAQAFAYALDCDGYAANFRGWRAYRALWPNSYDASPLRPDEIEALLSGRRPTAAAA
jgi:hypothetical protein